MADSNPRSVQSMVLLCFFLHKIMADLTVWILFAHLVLKNPKSNTMGYSPSCRIFCLLMSADQGWHLTMMEGAACSVIVSDPAGNTSEFCALANCVLKEE